MLEATVKARSLALIHFLASTGTTPEVIVDPVITVGALVGLPNPFRPDDEPEWCYAIRIHDGTDRAYWAFLTPEARRAVDHYVYLRRYWGETVGARSPLFVSIRGSKTDHMTATAATAVVRRLITLAKITTTKTGRQYTMDMFRKRFNMILKLDADADPDISCKLAGSGQRRGGSKSRDRTRKRPTCEQCYVEFLKAAPHLTISHVERLLLSNEDQRQKIDVISADIMKNDDPALLLEDLTRRLDFIEKTNPDHHIFRHDLVDDDDV